MPTFDGIPDDFINLLPQVGLGYDGPVYHLWAFDPQTARVTIENNEGRHPAESITHDAMREQILHPNAVFGYAYRIKGGWRITDEEHRPISDPYIVNQVLTALR